MNAKHINEIKSKLIGVEMHTIETTAFAEEYGLADSLVIHLRKQRNPLKANQLRKVFQSIKNIERDLSPKIRKNSKVKEEDFNRADIATIMVNLAYARGRKLIPSDFYDILTQCLSHNQLKRNKDFIRLAEFVEAVLAYYKLREVQDA